MKQWQYILFVVLVSTVILGGVPGHAAGPFQFHSLAPCRVFDTRDGAGEQTDGNPLGNPGPHSFRIQGRCGVPDGAAAATVNVTVVAPSQGGDLRLFPADAGQPLVSTLNYNAGEAALANGAILPLGTVSQLTDKDISVVIGMAASGTLHVIFDVTGYFQ